MKDSVKEYGPGEEFGDASVMKPFAELQGEERLKRILISLPAAPVFIAGTTVIVHMAALSETSDEYRIEEIAFKRYLLLPRRPKYADLTVDTFPSNPQG